MNLLRFDSEPHWLNGIAAIWRDRLRSNATMRLCLASGNTPIPIFRELVQSFRTGQISFKLATVFALDEFGGLAPDDAGRCRNMLQRDLIGHVDLPQSNFHFLNPEAADLELECRQYDQKIGEGFDLVLLGIGLNGHLGMNEPGSSLESASRRVDLHETTVSSSAKYVSHDRLPRWGLTAGMKQLFAAKEVWLIATGSGKAEIVQRLVKGEVTEQVPASLMRRHPNCSLFLDDLAGGRL